MRSAGILPAVAQGRLCRLSRGMKLGVPHFSPLLREVGFRQVENERVALARIFTTAASKEN